MQTIRITFQDLSYIDVQLSDDQLEDFRQWLRFAHQNDIFTIPGVDKEIRRKDIVKTISSVSSESDGLEK